MATFIGIDLAWKSERNTSGAVVLREQAGGAALVDVAPPLRSVADVMAYVRKHQGWPCVVAVDAPLIIPNATGQRSCERLVGQRYGNRDASCHTSNQTLYPDAASVHLAEALAAEGYRHAPGLADPHRERAVMLEVYPHAAMVALYDLPQIVKYKKGRLAEKQAGLAELQAFLRLLPRQEPRLVVDDQLRALLNRSVAGLGGRALKDHEDSLDALICAYVAFHYWTWAGTRTEVFGDLDSGYIANPLLQPGWAETLLLAGSNR